MGLSFVGITHAEGRVEPAERTQRLQRVRSPRQSIGAPMKSHLVVAFLMMIGTPACVAGVDANDNGDSAPGDEEIGQISSALATGVTITDWNSTYYGPQPLVQSAGTLCFLSKVWGSLANASHDIHIIDQDGYWKITGTQDTVRVRYAQAICVPQYHFKSSLPWAKRTLSNEFTTTATYNASGWYFGPPGGYSSINTTRGNEATILTGLAGDFNGPEKVSIAQSNDYSTFSRLDANSSAASVTTSLWARSFFVGPDGSTVAAKFTGPYDITGSAGPAGEFVSQGSTITMAKTAQAMCYFTHISGAFDSISNYAVINRFTDAQQNERWRLSTSSGVTAKVRCLNLQQ
jgi:hypothetical protein